MLLIHGIRNKAYEKNAKLREEVKCSKKGKKSTKSSVAQDPVENDQVSDQFAGMISSEGWKPDPVEKRKKRQQIFTDVRRLLKTLLPSIKLIKLKILINSIREGWQLILKLR